MNPDADPVIVDYFKEAVLTYNAGCPKASTVMMGCASEQAVLVLHQAFMSAMSDTSKNLFTGALGRKRTFVALP